MKIAGLAGRGLLRDLHDLLVPAPGVETAEAHGLLVVMDGRIFNRSELPVPDEDGDAALLAALVRRHGPAGAMTRLNADLAAAVYEPASGRLWLMRDRLGMRPLYWARHRGAVAFASRPRPLLRLLGARAEPDPQYLARVAAAHYRAIDNAPARSPYLGIAQVPAATVVAIDGDEVHAERYWRPDPEPLDLDEEAAGERLRALLADAVARRLAVSERPAFTLSGGLDSSSVLATAARQAGPQHAYSTVYEDETYDERHEIAPMAEAAAERWHAVEIEGSDVLEAVERMVAEQDEPVVTATWLSHYELAHRAAADGVTHLFGGLGGDETCAGEYEYFPYHFADLRSAGREADLAHEIDRWARHHDHPVFHKDRAVAEEAMRRLTDPARPGRCRPDRERLARYRDALSPDLPDLAEIAQEMEHPFDSCLANRTWQDLTRETLPPCLRAEDRTLSALGMERFHPFLDHRIVELAFRLPGDMKIRDGVTKRWLRTAMRGVLPEETRTRIAKTGWNAPAHRWFSGEGREGLLDLVRSRSFRERGVYRPDEVERIAAEHVAIVASGEPRENHMMFLWQVVNTELWLRDLDAQRTAERPAELSPLAAP